MRQDAQNDSDADADALFDVAAREGALFVYGDTEDVNININIPCSCAGCPTGNGEKLNCSQAKQSQAINLAVAKFSSISCGAS